MTAIGPTTFDLSVKNPNGSEELAHRSPADIMNEIATLEAESTEVLRNIRAESREEARRAGGVEEVSAAPGLGQL